ncbi:hypothetical protein NP493_159g02084 [Ridgeia piscesae]|uniref:Alpha-L-iduronidase n=1 Tax=Ridgeia piscesae TaxID=27915 RepID=A0AAD9UFK9_RIDPI|nr:hypothetical protein NP493_159g02084 [Ridgeia piscesae]
MRHNLAYLGSLPHGALEQVRTHWLLDMVSITRIEQGMPHYNFTQLDSFIEELSSNGLKPGFEIMGNPSGFFSDFENLTQVHLWRDLVHDIAHRYIDMYGLGFVQTWNFETWNEPKMRHFDGLNFTIQGFLNYFDACWEGLKSASPSLRLGGPGGACVDHFNPRTYCWALLQHAHNGVNFFTGRRQRRLDYISIHKKGSEPDNTEVMLEKESAFVEILRKHLPQLLDIPIYNDEADPLVGWSKPRWWRADATYAAVIAKVIVSHQRRWCHQHTNEIGDTRVTFSLLSNDNGFLSYNPHFFTQRTLLARFQMNMTSPSHVHFIRKPAFGVMSLLGMLGETQVRSVMLDSTGAALDDKGSLGVLATTHAPLDPRDTWRLSVLVYNSHDTHNVSGDTSLLVHFDQLPDSKDLTYMTHRLDNMHGNPYAVWLDAGQPVQPSGSVLQAMRDSQEAQSEGPFPLFESSKGHVTFSWNVALPGVFLFHACAKAPMPPDQVADLRVLNITSGQVLVVWSDHCVHSRCLHTFEVEFCRHSEAGKYKRINTIDSIVTSYVFAPETDGLAHGLADALVWGLYRVRAVDYWNRPSPYSLVTPYGP